MKSRIVILYLWPFLIMLFVPSCAQSISDEKLPIPDFHKTTRLSSDITDTVLPTSSIEKDPNATLVVAATYDTEKANIKFLELLNDNGGCQLPCLWGITPGESTFQEAYDILAPLSGISRNTELTPDSGVLIPEYIENDFTLTSTIGFSSNNQMVDHVAFQSGAFGENPDGYYSIFDSSSFGDKIRAYTLPKILSEQGVPAGVLISTDGGHNRGNNVPGFYVLLFYPDQGLLVSYTTSRELKEGIVRGCLANAHVELELYPSESPGSYSEYLSKTKWTNLWPIPADSPNWKPVEEVTSMSVEEFYQLFLDPTNQCIETPAELWPVPEF